MRIFSDCVRNGFGLAVLSLGVALTSLACDNGDGGEDGATAEPAAAEPAAAEPAAAEPAAAEPAAAEPTAAEPAAAEPTAAEPTTEEPAAELEISGSWENEWGTDEITSTSWNTMAITLFDNEANWVVSQNPTDDTVGTPDKFNKIAWTELAEGSFYYCWIAFGLDTEESAIEATDDADRDDLDGAGCYGFPWTFAESSEG